MIKLHEYLNETTETGKQLKEKQQKHLLSILLNQANMQAGGAKAFTPRTLFKMSTRKIKDETNDSPKINRNSDIKRDIDDLKNRSRAFNDFMKRVVSDSPKVANFVTKKTELLSPTQKKNVSSRRSIVKSPPM